ncbi:hypothetical protein FZW96_02780 [Bacillus sp. BGMRC 2118]|nr:hypothetical protein FZW96_02780 [Bacillus sp. BGMRC 2118]
MRQAGGGGQKTAKNQSSACIVASECNTSISVGSQMSALKNPSEQRMENPKGVILSNLGSKATVGLAKRDIDMIGKNGLQIQSANQYVGYNSSLVFQAWNLYKKHLAKQKNSSQKVSCFLFWSGFS